MNLIALVVAILMALFGGRLRAMGLRPGQIAHVEVVEDDMDNLEARLTMLNGGHHTIVFRKPNGFSRRARATNRRLREAFEESLQAYIRPSALENLVGVTVLGEEP